MCTYVVVIGVKVHLDSPPHLQHLTGHNVPVEGSTCVPLIFLMPK